MKMVSGSRGCPRRWQFGRITSGVNKIGEVGLISARGGERRGKRAPSIFASLFRAEAG